MRSASGRVTTALTRKYHVSIAAAERAMLPQIRSAGADTAILANGFSCREQIEQCTGRKTMHIAEVLADARTRRRDPQECGAISIERVV